MNPGSDHKDQPQRLRVRLKEATCSAILGAAEEIFGAEGWHAARMEEIAVRAGVSVGTLYNHFADREALIGELIDARRAEMLARFDDALEATATAPFAEQLRKVVQALGEHFEAHQAFLAILFEGEHERSSRAFPVACTKPRLAMQAMYERFELLVKRGVKSKALRPAGADLYPALLLGMVKGVTVRSLYYDGKLGELKARANEIAELFLTGAGARR